VALEALPPPLAARPTNEYLRLKHLNPKAFFDPLDKKPKNMWPAAPKSPQLYAEIARVPAALTSGWLDEQAAYPPLHPGRWRRDRHLFLPKPDVRHRPSEDSLRPHPSSELALASTLYPLLLLPFGLFTLSCQSNPKRKRGRARERRKA